MKIDLYTNIIQTFIVEALWGILLKSLLIPHAFAQNDKIVDVNIKKIGDKLVSKKQLIVNINAVGGFNVGTPKLPVQTNEKY